MKIALNGTKVRAFKGVDKKGRGYEFITLWGRDDKDNPVRVIFNNRAIYGAITSAPLTILDTVEVEALTKKERTFTGRAGEPVTVVEVTDPMPTGIERSTFPTTEKWPDWETLMAEAPAPATGSGADSEADSEAEF